MYSKIAISAFLRVSHVSRQINSALIAARQGIAQQCPERGFEERLNSRIVIAISFATHGHFEAVLSQDFLIVVRTILRPAIRVMDAALWRRSEGH